MNVLTLVSRIFSFHWRNILLLQGILHLVQVNCRQGQDIGQKSSAKAVVTINLKKYEDKTHKKCDNWDARCDVYMQLCITDHMCTTANSANRVDDTVGFLFRDQPRTYSYNPSYWYLDHWSGNFLLHVKILDYDIFGSNDLVGNIRYPFSGRPGSNITAIVGTQEDTNIQLTFQITVKCLPHYYGSNCTTHCVANQHLHCTANGTRVCSIGFSGVNCETNINDCNPNPCYHGKCTDEVNRYRCDCNSGYSGVNCETDIDDCNPNPCHHGNCTDGVGTYSCACAEGYTGKNCDVVKDYCIAATCQNGSCVSGIGHLTCECFAGYTGNLCQTDIEDCSPNSCNHRGVCHDGINKLSCHCDHGYTGLRCDTQLPIPASSSDMSTVSVYASAMPSVSSFIYTSQPITPRVEHFTSDLPTYSVLHTTSSPKVGHSTNKLSLATYTSYLQQTSIQSWAPSTSVVTSTLESSSTYVSYPAQTSNQGLSPATTGVTSSLESSSTYASYSEQTSNQEEKIASSWQASSTYIMPYSTRSSTPGLAPWTYDITSSPLTYTPYTALTSNPGETGVSSWQVSPTYSRYSTHTGTPGLAPSTNDITSSSVTNTPYSAAASSTAKGIVSSWQTSSAYALTSSSPEKEIASNYQASAIYPPNFAQTNGIQIKISSSELPSAAHTAHPTPTSSPGVGPESEYVSRATTPTLYPVPASQTTDEQSSSTDHVTVSPTQTSLTASPTASLTASLTSTVPTSQEDPLVIRIQILGDVVNMTETIKDHVIGLLGTTDVTVVVESIRIIQGQHGETVTDVTFAVTSRNKTVPVSMATLRDSVSKALATLQLKQYDDKVVGNTASPAKAWIHDHVMVIGILAAVLVLVVITSAVIVIKKRRKQRKRKHEYLQESAVSEYGGINLEPITCNENTFDNPVYSERVFNEKSSTASEHL